MRLSKIEKQSFIFGRYDVVTPVMRFRFMIASDMTNPNNANAQLFHWYPNAVNAESFRGSTLESLRQGMMASEPSGLKSKAAQAVAP